MTFNLGWFAERNRPEYDRLSRCPHQRQPVRRSLASVESRRQAVSDQLEDQKRSTLGQFFTPSSVARLIASLPTLPVFPALSEYSTLGQGSDRFRRR